MKIHYAEESPHESNIYIGIISLIGIGTLIAIQMSGVHITLVDKLAPYTISVDPPELRFTCPSGRT